GGSTAARPPCRRACDLVRAAPATGPRRAAGRPAGSTSAGTPTTPSWLPCPCPCPCRPTPNQRPAIAKKPARPGSHPSPSPSRAAYYRPSPRERCIRLASYGGQPIGADDTATSSIQNVRASSAWYDSQPRSRWSNTGAAQTKSGVALTQPSPVPVTVRSGSATPSSDSVISLFPPSNFHSRQDHLPVGSTVLLEWCQQSLAGPVPEPIGYESGVS